MDESRSPIQPDDETVREDPGATLTITLVGSGEKRREWRFVPGDTVCIGRGADANVLFDDPAISRRHATLDYSDGQWVYRHLGTNPTLRDGRPVKEAAVVSSLVVRLHANGPRLRLDAGHVAVDRENRSSKPITVWMQELANGNGEAATHLWEAYFQRIARLAKLRLKPSLRRVADEEDVAASVFASLCDGILAGRFPELSSRDNLWRLLASMTARKAIDVANREQRKKRGGGNVRGESIFLGSNGEFGFEQFLAIADSPDFESQLVEEVEIRLDVLGDDELRRVAQLRLEGYTVDEIAKRLECNPRTVQRRLQSIREKWGDVDVRDNE